MLRFRQWLLIVEGRKDLIPTEVLQGYENAFKEELRKLIQRTDNPNLRAKFAEMLECPIRDSSGGWRSFADYIYSALIRNGIHHKHDIEAAFAYVFQQMMMGTKETGEPKITVFGGFRQRPDQTDDFNPLQARFLTFLRHAIHAIRQGRVPRLADVGRWPAGTVSIGQSRKTVGDRTAGVSQAEIPDRPSSDRDLGEMVDDVLALLKKKEGAYGFPLVDLFKAIMGGMTVEQQRKTFGDRRVRPARQAIVQTVEEYARSTDNVLLLHLLQRLRDRPEEEAPQQQTPVKAPKPILSDQQRDYASIASVIARFERPVGTADLGRFRRRWLEYPPRDPASGYRNRLEEVLAKMVEDGVLRTTPTRGGAVAYLPGPRFEEVQQEAGVE